MDGLQSIEEASFIVTADNDSPEKVSIEVIRVFLVILPIVFTSVLADFLSTKLCQRNSFKEFIIQVLIIVAPLIITVTVGVKCVCNVISPILIIASTGIGYYCFKKWRKNGSLSKFKIPVNERPQSITLLKSAINITTSCAILAVDFEIFPHDFHKSITFGVGLMDTGIGLFIGIMGMVSKPLRTFNDLRKMLIQVAPLIFLGILRTVIIRTIGYYQDEREYGRDLNAFITLGMTKLIAGLISIAVPFGVPFLVPAIIVVGLHEAILHSGVGSYCLSEVVPRSSLFEANREGIVSITGFVSIYLVSLHIGLLVRNTKTENFQEFKMVLMKTVHVCLAAWMLTFVCIYTTGISRRLANLGYVAWTVSLSTSILSIFMITFDVILKLVYKNNRRCVPVLFDVINFNGLIYFLVSNVLTGAVNLFLNPSQRSSFESIVILIVYMTIPCILNRFLYVKNLRIC